ncbi:MAG: acetyl-CoA carboxylase biotin carboxylase subunit [Saprospiraceae bacterium]|nr:acetyl-CoA carboxylase biotin carboxylase subunit [Saprospiraceae bacterium]
MKKILVANRGEIAVRVIQSAKALGIKTVAIYSEADRNGLPVRCADEAVCVGPAPSSQSYLNGDKIIEVAKSLNVDGIHPGYGFLSENADFARKVEQNGIRFIGPSPESMEVMGSKLAAKKAVAAYDVPLVPGTDEAISDIAKAKQIAQEIGFPILIKASAGGGGKGMRIVEKEADFEGQMKRAVSEATSAFGDGSVFIERYIATSRHIEIQILGDTHGNIVYLFERECSIQRRHQKVIEEAPSVVLSPELRKEMGECAVNVARSCNYYGAGTVEFLLDDQHNFYFLEMNTRLQVEHPVTEFITGLDLVEEQINIARGQVLGFKQDDLHIHGHAIELRVYAEDSFDNFMPSIGVLEHYSEPKSDHVRVDGGYVQGDEVSVFFDPLISKLIVWGDNRIKAIQLMREAIDNYDIRGLETTLPFGRYVMNHDAFVSGHFDTSFVDQYFNRDIITDINEKEGKIAAIVAFKLNDNGQMSNPIHIERPSQWRQLT